jgi:hypothetical protein
VQVVARGMESLEKTRNGMQSRKSSTPKTSISSTFYLNVWVKTKRKSVRDCYKRERIGSNNWRTQNEI